MRPADVASSSKSASDISHLVRKKVGMLSLTLIECSFAVELKLAYFHVPSNGVEQV